MKSDEEVLKTHDDAEMMCRPHLWQSNALPLKRPRDNDLPQLAMLVREGDLFLLYENQSIMGISFDGEIIEHEFTNADDILALGWQVD